ncbi:MAG: DUF927 domain-containing protein, partial [Deltaproteobacteria bacterium]
MPRGYRCSEDGVFILGEDEDERLTFQPCHVDAMSRDGRGESWGRLVVWCDYDRREHREAIPAALFHANSTELAQHLADRGLPIVPGKERKLIQYLAAFRPDARLMAATSTGWHGKVFVLPHLVVGEPEGERIVYQPDERRLDDCFQRVGSFEAWMEAMRDVSAHVRFAVAASLAAPVMYRAGVASGGFHFYGLTSRGKTTLLQAAASVWGNGADPAVQGGGDAFIQRWNATRNGLEGMAASFNDLPLIVDEIGEGDSREFGRTVYQLMAGTGKSRATRTGALAKRRAWRVLLLSAGEIAVADFIEQAKGGHLVRLVDIPARDLFRDAESVNAMKAACAANFGWAGPAFLESGNLLDGWQELEPEVIGDVRTPEAGRVRERFRLVAHAGELAIKRGFVPWERGAVLEACRMLFAEWAEAGSATDAERGIEAVRQFILANPARFEHDGQSIETINRAGIVRDGCYHFFPAAFREACGAVSPDVVKRALFEAGLLHVSETGRLQSRIRVAGHLTRVISVRAGILADVSKTGGNTGNTGHSPCPASKDAVPSDWEQVGTPGTPVPTVPTTGNGVGTPENPYFPTPVPTVHTVPTENREP